MNGVVIDDEDQEIEIIYEFFDTVNEELKSKNRFSNDKLDKLIDVLVNEETNIEELEAGTIFFRARKYTENDAKTRFLSPPETSFQGYDKVNSYANLHAPNEGRCNPIFIPYLYVAESVPCCIHEIGAHIGDIVSVAEIKVKEPLKILSLSKRFAISNGMPSVIEGIQDSTITLLLEGIFSKRHEKQWDYLTTQYIAEKVKNKGFDGISFFSSVYSGDDRTNYTIFNLEKCEAVKSKLCKISNIAVEYTFDAPSNVEVDREYLESDEAAEEFEKALFGES